MFEMGFFPLFYEWEVAWYITIFSGMTTDFYHCILEVYDWFHHLTTLPTHLRMSPSILGIAISDLPCFDQGLLYLRLLSWKE